ncbi:MAG: hypothetical protein AAGL29_00125 [Bacteroidota bacterium]
MEEKSTLNASFALVISLKSEKTNANVLLETEPVADLIYNSYLTCKDNSERHLIQKLSFNFEGSQGEILLRVILFTLAPD